MKINAQHNALSKAMAIKTRFKTENIYLNLGFMVLLKALWHYSSLLEFGFRLARLWLHH